MLKNNAEALSTDDKKEHPKQPKRSSTDEFPIQEYKLVPVDHMEYSNNEDEIDLIELAKTIWDNRKTIYKFVGVGFVLGILVALLSPKEYVSSATLMPEYATEGDLGGASSLLQKYGGLIGLSGGSYNSASNAIRVDLYPKIVSSLSFQLKLAEQEFYFADYDTTASIMDYYLEIQSLGMIGFLSEYTIGLPGKIIKATTSEEKVSEKSIDPDIISVSEDEMEVIEDLRERIKASLDEESGVISVYAKMQDPKLAAEVAKYTIEELTDYLVEYRTEKVIRDLDFIEGQLNDARARFREAQLALAEFDDTNRGSLTARAQTERQRLQSEYDIAFNLYNSLNQQFEEAKLKVQEETPIFKILQPVQVPVNDETSGAIILIVFVIMSGIASVGWIFIRQFLDTNPFLSR